MPKPKTTYTPGPAWAVGPNGLDPAYEARVAAQWLEVFKQTHGGLAPAEWNAQYGQQGRVGTANAPAAIPQATDSANFTPTIMPFLTADDLMTLNQFQTGNETSIAQIDAALAQQATDTAFQKTELDRSARKGSSETADQMAARGLFQSSIKDAALYDISAQKTIRQNLLDDQLHNAQLSAQRQKQIIQASIARMNAAMNAKGVERAAEQSAGTPDTITPAGTTGGSPAPAPAPSPYRGPVPLNGPNGTNHTAQPTTTLHSGKGKKNSGWG